MDLEFLSSNGVTKVHAKVWEPETSEIKGVVQIAHGMVEHSGRYDNFAKYLARKGFVVCANDHLGHGRTAGQDFGYMGKDGYKYMVDDMHLLFELINPKYNKPYFLLGHSMGSFLTRYYAVRNGYGKQLAGIIYSGTGNADSYEKILIPLCDLMGLIHGRKKPAKFFAGVSSKTFNKSFKPASTGGEWLSRDVSIVKKYLSDPFSKFIFTYDGYSNLFRLRQQISSSKWARSVPKDLPVLIFSGERDPVGKFSKDVKAVYKSLQNAGCTDVTMKLYKNGRHEMLNEINRKEVYLDIYNWLLRKL